MADTDYVTDPALLEQLNAPAAPPSADGYVSDPDLLRQLNGPEPSAGGYVNDPDLLQQLNAPVAAPPPRSGLPRKVRPSPDPEQLARIGIQPPGAEKPNQPQEPRGILERLKSGFMGGFGEGPLGVSPETQAKYPWSTGLQPLAVPIDLAMRAIPGAIGAVSAVPPALGEATGIMSPTMADRMQRDLGIMGQGLMFEGGGGGILGQGARPGGSLPSLRDARIAPSAIDPTLDAALQAQTATREPVQTQLPLPKPMAPGQQVDLPFQGPSPYGPTAEAALLRAEEARARGQHGAADMFERMALAQERAPPEGVAPLPQPAGATRYYGTPAATQDLGPGQRPPYAQDPATARHGTPGSKGGAGTAEVQPPPLKANVGGDTQISTRSERSYPKAGEAPVAQSAPVRGSTDPTLNAVFEAERTAQAPPAELLAQRAAEAVPGPTEGPAAGAASGAEIEHNPLDMVRSGELSADRALALAEEYKNRHKTVVDAVLGDNAEAWRRAHQRSDMYWDRAEDAKAKVQDALIAGIEAKHPPETIDAMYRKLEQGEHTDPQGWRDFSRDLRDVEGSREDAVATVGYTLRRLPETGKALGQTDRENLALIQHALDQEARRGGDPQSFLHDAFAKSSERYGGGADAAELTADHMARLRELMRSDNAGRAAPGPRQLAGPGAGTPSAPSRAIAAERAPDDAVHEPAPGEQPGEGIKKKVGDRVMMPPDEGGAPVPHEVVEFTKDGKVTVKDPNGKSIPGLQQAYLDARPFAPETPPPPAEAGIVRHKDHYTIAGDVDVNGELNPHQYRDAYDKQIPELEKRIANLEKRIERTRKLGRDPHIKDPQLADASLVLPLRERDLDDLRFHLEATRRLREEALERTAPATPREAIAQRAPGETVGDALRQPTTPRTSLKFDDPAKEARFQEYRRGKTIYDPVEAKEFEARVGAETDKAFSRQPTPSVTPQEATPAAGSSPLVQAVKNFISSEKGGGKLPELTAADYQALAAVARRMGRTAMALRYETLAQSGDQREAPRASEQAPSGAPPRAPPPSPPPSPRIALPDNNRAYAAAQLADDQLHQLASRPAANAIDYNDRMREAVATHPEIKGSGGERIYKAIENGTYDQLPARLRAAYEKTTGDLTREAEAVRQELIERGKIEPDEAASDPHYVHRIVKSSPLKSPNPDPLSPIGGIPGMYDPSSAKPLKLMGAQAADGSRVVVSSAEDGGQIRILKGRGKADAVANPKHNQGGDLRTGDTFEYKGKRYTVDRGRTDEIEKVALHNDAFAAGDRTPVQYHKNAFLSAFDYHRQMTMRKAFADWAENFKSENSPFREFMTKSEGEAGRLGWARSEVPGFQDIYMHPDLAQVLHNNYRPGLGMGEMGWLRAVNQFAVRSMFWNPVPHSLNAGTHYAIGRGWDWLPLPRNSFGLDFARATFDGFKSAITQDQLLQDLNKAGASLVMSKIDSRNVADNIGSLLKTDLRNNPGKWEQFARNLGVGKGIDAVNMIYNGSARMLWTFSDALMISRIRELEMRGMSREQAINEARIHMPDYRLPIKLLGSRNAVNAMSDPTLAVFGRYHMGLVNSLGHMATDLLGPRATASQRIEALGNVAALVTLGLVVKPALDQVVQYVTGNKKAEFVRRGPLGLLQNIYDAARTGKKSWGDVASGVFTMNPVAKLLLQTYANRDNLGREIIQQGSPLLSQAGQLVEKVAGSLVQPYEMVSESLTPSSSKGDLPREVLTQLTNTKVPTPRQLRSQQIGQRITGKQIIKREQRPHGLLETGATRLRRSLGSQQ